MQLRCSSCAITALSFYVFVFLFGKLILISKVLFIIMKRKYILTGLLVLFISGVATVYRMWHNPGKMVESEEGIALSIDKLCQDFSTNEATANKLYLNKAIEVRGQINEISNNLDGGTMLVFSASNGIDYVESTLREKIPGLEPGTSVIIKGFCVGKTITGVSLTDCIIVR